MNKIKLTRQDEPDFDELYRMIGELKDFLKEDMGSRNWMKNLETILDFQDTDGSFKLFTSYEIPSDARVDFCHMPTYICTAILMKSYLIGDSKLSKKIDRPLRRGLKACCMRNLMGHGYEALEGQIEALNIFMKAGLREFIDLYPDMSRKFSKMISNICGSNFEMLESLRNALLGPWGEDYKEDILKINKYFNTRRVFVYGTLMNGESNHHFLENSNCLGASTVEGYQMYNVGWYPAIVPGDGMIIGELYEVPQEDMARIDMLEGEGSLYIRKCEMTSSKSLAYIYEFLEDTEGLDRISSWKDYIWYVSYGSNMLYDRFICYIEGGSYEGSSSYRMPCEDTSAPVEVRAVEIPHDMYFGNYSGSWHGGGVSFLDTEKDGHALGTAYLITREQFEHVAAEENGGRYPDGTGNWYEDIISLGDMDGFEMLTVTNKKPREQNEPSEEYLETLKRGIRENWPDMSEEDIGRYLNSCIRE
ncbi:gamma-glutamylcyclotransferase family protein [Methanobrevibacter ruminantium]|nr:gamma-glutamylcyclotransferase family protein [Methanobrevibacter ruminantium]